MYLSTINLFALGKLAFVCNNYYRLSKFYLLLRLKLVLLIARSIECLDEQSDKLNGPRNKRTIEHLNLNNNLKPSNQHPQNFNTGHNNNNPLLNPQPNQQPNQQLSQQINPQPNQQPNQIQNQQPNQQPNQMQNQQPDQMQNQQQNQQPNQQPDQMQNRQPNQQSNQSPPGKVLRFHYTFKNCFY